MLSSLPLSLFFFFNDTATTEIYTLSPHDALPISVLLHEEYVRARRVHGDVVNAVADLGIRVWDILGMQSLVDRPLRSPRDRKSTRLNSSHSQISYAVFCLKKKNKALNHMS